MRNELANGNAIGVCLSRLIWSIVLVLLLAVIPSFAQSSGTILGVVKDSSGGTVPDAQVTATSVETDAVRTATTGSDGEYRLPGLQPGHYKIKVEKNGFKTTTQAGVTLDVASQITVNATLEVGTSTQEVTVTGDAPLVETTTSSLAGLINDQKMAELPLNGRNFIDLALLQPGVVNYTNLQRTQAQGGNWGVVFSSNGAPVRSNTFTIDGANMMNLHGTAASGIGTTLGVDGIKEYKVITSAFSAEYGQQMGSQVVIVSKGGSNQFHGDVFDYLRNSVLDAANFFDKPSVANGNRRLPEFQRNNFGAAFGGPIKKDKTFFYANYEGLRQILGLTTIDTVIPTGCNVIAHNPCAITAANPTGAVAPVVQSILALYPQPNYLLPSASFAYSAAQPTGINFGQIRVDHNFSASDSFFARYTIQDPNNVNAFQYPQFQLQSFGRDQFLTFSESHIFSPTVLNTARAHFSRTNVQQVPLFPANIIGPQFSLVAGQPMGTITINDGRTDIGPTGNAPSRLLQNIYTFSDDVYYTKGKHAFKFGILFNRYENYLDASNGVKGTIQFDNVSNFLNAKYSQAQYFTTYVGAKNPLYYTLGFYAQDDWRVTSRFTLNLGLRYEFNTDLTDRLGNAWAFVPCLVCNGGNPPLVNGRYTANPSYHNVSPRVGFGWDLFGNGKTSVRAAFGEYYDLANYGFQIYGSSNGQPPLTSQLTLPPNFDPVTGNILTPLVLPITNTPVSGSTAKTLSNLQYNIHQPRLLQWNFSVEQQLAPNLSLSLAYVHTRGEHLWDQEEGNPCVPLSVTNGSPSWANPGNLHCPGLVNGVLTANAGRPNPTYSTAGYRATNGDSSYNALQAVVTKRVSNGLQVVGAYTYSRVIDDGQGQFGPSECAGLGGSNAVANDEYANDRRFDRGPACFNATHNLRITMLYHLPFVKSENAIARGVLNGWWMGSLVSWETGEPLNIVVINSRSLSDNLSNTGGTHVDLGTATVAPGAKGPDGTTNTAPGNVTFIPYNPATVVTGNPSQWFNPLMFNPGRVGFLGTSPRNTVEGPHLSNFDINFNKDTAVHFLGEAGQIEFRAEFFNIFNHPNFGMPNGAAYSGSPSHTSYAEAPNANAGQINNTVTTSRQVQLSLKIIF